MTNMDRIWIGLRIHPSDMEWIDQSPVRYVNFNPLLLGMQRDVKVNVRLNSLHNVVDLHHVRLPGIILFSSIVIIIDGGQIKHNVNT